jgi:L-amino acid N-acyltransferase YncA
MSRITIRAVRASDAGGIAAIYAHHVRHGSASFDTEPFSEADTRAKIETITGRGWPFFVADREGEAVGYAYATQFRDRHGYRFTCEDSIYVRADSHGQGIGGALLAATIEAAEAFGFRQMIAVIGGGEPASIALHERAGFVHAGRMKSVGHKFGRWLDTVYMQRSLGAGDSD